MTSISIILSRLYYQFIDLAALYTKLLESGRITQNPAQTALINKLQERLRVLHKPRSSWFCPRSHLKRGVYMYGEVGTGKTMLMDIFYEACGFMGASRERLHFNQFMAMTHERVHDLRKRGTAGDRIISRIASELSSRNKLLCLDEFQVVDIADAMLLRVLLDELLQKRVSPFLIITSNRAPSELYTNGIQRASFLPCIKLIEDQLDVYCLDSGKDFRLDANGKLEHFLYPIDTKTSEKMKLMFEYAADGQNECEKIIRVLGRDISVKIAAGRVALFHFDELLRSPMASPDYLALAEHFDTFFISNVPCFNSLDMRVEARRFMTLIDILYDARKNVVIQTAVPIKELFAMRSMRSSAISEQEVLDELQHNRDVSILTGEEENFAAARTISRLHQMTSRDWDKMQ